jgi:hypothetical protein
LRLLVLMSYHSHVHVLDSSMLTHAPRHIDTCLYDYMRVDAIESPFWRELDRVNAQVDNGIRFLTRLGACTLNPKVDVFLESTALIFGEHIPKIKL